MAGLTLDSSALIAFERVDRRIILHLKEAELRGLELTIPTAVIVEAWRSVVDAVVMSSAAQRNDRVLTADLDDLKRLHRHFPGVRLVRLKPVTSDASTHR